MKKILIIIALNFTFTQVINTTQGIAYSSINDAIEEVNDYDVIVVESGTYYERVNIWNPLTLSSSEGAVINASDYSRGIVISANDVNISGFEIIGNENTIAGIEVTPGSSNVTLSSNIIHGMSLGNLSNESPLSYGILAYGNEGTPNPPENLVITNNEIYEISGTGISLGEYTTNTTITNNNIHDIEPIIFSDNLIPGEDYTSFGIIGTFSNQVLIENNIFTNITAATSFGIANGTIQNNSYTNTSIFLASVFFTNLSDDEFTFLLADEPDSYYARSTSTFSDIFTMYAYCSSLSIAQLTADDGTIILTSDGEEIIQDCSGEWGGELIPICGDCNNNLSGDVNNDQSTDVLDIIVMINYITNAIELDEISICLGDVDLNGTLNILDIVTLVQQIISQ